MSDTPRTIPPEHAGIKAYAYPDLWDYHLGVAGEGPHAYKWSDKPHRLVYDLTAKCADLRESLSAANAKLEMALVDARQMKACWDAACNDIHELQEKLAKARPSEEAVNVARFIVSVSASRQANIAARELLRLDELAKPNRKE